MAKFGAITALALRRLEAGPEVVDVGRGEAGRADDRVDVVVRAPDEVLAGGVDHGEVDHDLGLGVGERVEMRRDLHAGRVDTELAEVDARVQRVDRGDELELGVVEHRATDRRAHAPCRSHHTHANHCGTRIMCAG